VLTQGTHGELNADINAIDGEHPKHTGMTTSPAREVPERLSAQLLQLADREEHAELTLGGLMDELQGRVYTLLLVILALPMCQPIPLPGLSTPLGVAIALLGLRFALSQHPWMPQRLLVTKLSGNFFPAVMRGGARVLGFLEKLLHPRLVRMFEPAYMRFFAGVAICLCGLLLLLPLPIPGTNMLPALTVVLTAAAFSERDGYCLVAAGIVFFLTLIFFGALVWGSAEIIGHFAPKAA
jgi:hypothetical protein